MEDRNINYGEMIEGLGKDIPLELYEEKEVENGYIFTLKDEVLEKGGLTEFLNEQYKLLNIETDRVEEIISRLSEVTSADEIIEIAEKKRYTNFQYADVYDYIHCKPWGEYMMVECEMAIFMVEGKIIMEAYRRFLWYMENLIKKDNPHFISKTVKVVIG